MEKDIYRRMAKLEKTHWWFCARRKILRFLIGDYLEIVPPVDVLEAGCGTGGNLDLLKNFGYVKAFELDKDAIGIARSRGHKIEEGYLPDNIPFTGEQFDLIVLPDVLEHVKEDIPSLTALGDRLKPGGRIMLTVPAHPVLWSQHDVRHHHFRRYTKTSLSDAIQQAGLEVVRISYFNFILFPVAAPVRLLKKLLRVKKSDDDKMPARWINSLLFRMFASERHLLRYINLPIGLSIFAIAGKTDYDNAQNNSS
jgi:SAM-dependent methyltransferase